MSNEKPTPEILRVVIEQIKIEVQAGKYAKNSLQEVRIIYRVIKIVYTDLMVIKKSD